MQDATSPHGNSSPAITQKDKSPPSPSSATPSTNSPRPRRTSKATAGTRPTTRHTRRNPRALERPSAPDGELVADQTRLQQAATAAQDNRQALRKLADEQAALTSAPRRSPMPLRERRPPWLLWTKPLTNGGSGRAFAQTEPAKEACTNCCPNSLAKAGQELAQATSQAEQAQQSLAAAENTRQKLAELTIAQQQLNAQSAPAATHVPISATGGADAGASRAPEQTSRTVAGTSSTEHAAGQSEPQQKPARGDPPGTTGSD